MKINFKYRDRISQYIIDNDTKKTLQHGTIIINKNDTMKHSDDDDLLRDNYSTTNDILIDLWGDMKHMKELKKIFSEDKVFTDLFAEEIFVECRVCSRDANYPREHLGIVKFVYDWLCGRVDLVSPNPSLMEYLGELQFAHLDKLSRSL